jgi:hypothetical protein
MSWDIFVQDLPRDAESVKNIPADFKPSPIGRRSIIIEKILEIVPTADFSDPAWGRIDGDGWSIEVNIGAEEECRSFAFHVRGGDAAVGAIAAILEHLNLRALSSQAGGFFVANMEAVEAFRKWRGYRDQVVERP